MAEKNSDGFAPGQRVEWGDMRRADLTRSGGGSNADDAKKSVAEDATGEIPDGWRKLHWKKQVSLAQSLGSEAETQDGAVTYIEAEVNRRNGD